jgi:putative transcription factor
MECEICGKSTLNNKIIEFEGQELIVCSGCSSFGREKIKKEKKESLIQPRKKPFHQKDLDAGFELIENWGNKIKRERELRGLTIKELARKLFEKESVMHKIEQEKIFPSNTLIEKIEKFFGISLREKIKNEKILMQQEIKKPTLEDFLKTEGKQK